MKRTAALALFSGGIALYCLVPFLWFVLTSLKSAAELTAIPPILLPSFHLSFYRSALENYGLLHYIANSMIVAGLGDDGHRRDWFAGGLRHRAFSVEVDAFLPAAAARDFDVSTDRHRRSGLDDPRPLAVAQHVPRPGGGLRRLSLPLATWILATFFRDVPVEIEEAALIDGCSRLQALYKVVLPLAAPGILTAALLVFIYAWNEFFFALDHHDRSQRSNPTRWDCAVPRRIHDAVGRDRRGVDDRHRAADLAHADFSTRHRARLIGGRGERLNRNGGDYRCALGQEIIQAVRC